MIYYVYWTMYIILCIYILYEIDIYIYTLYDIYIYHMYPIFSPSAESHLPRLQSTQHRPERRWRTPDAMGEIPGKHGDSTNKHQDSINRNLRSPRHASQMLGSSVLGHARWAFSQSHAWFFSKDNQKVYPKRKPNLAGGQSWNIDQPSLDSSADTLPAQRPCWWGPRFVDAQRKGGWVFGWKRWQPV